MKTSGLNRKRLIRIVVIFLIMLLLAVYIGLPVMMALAAVAPDESASSAPPEGFTEVTLTTADNLHLGAWYAEPVNGSVIILVHGAGSGRESVRAYATMLQQNGFGVMALNLRGYGGSEGHINRLGWNGTTDVGAAVNYLTTRQQVNPVNAIGALGTSMGGEVLLGAASKYPAIRAVIADGATFRAVSEYTSLSYNQPLYRNFTHRIFTFAVGVLSGDRPPEPPLIESIQAAETTSFLLIAAGNVGDEIDYNTFFCETIPDRSSLWVIPNVGHTGGFSHDPAEYERRVVEFFRQTLLKQPRLES